MSKTTLGFIISGLFYLTLGVTLGALFFMIPETRALRTVHGHLNLVGFVMFIIFGVAYHILPRFRGRPLYSEGLAWVGFWLANAGLAGMLVITGIGSYRALGDLAFLQAAFGALLALSMYIFIYNMIEP